MDTATLFRTQVPGTTVTLCPDWFVLTDGVEERLPPMVGGRHVADAARVKVFIDHETPCGSEPVADRQRELIRFAQRENCQVFNGYGVSYQIMLDQFVKAGDLVVQCGEFGGVYGCAGAVVVSLTPSEMAQALCTGEISVTVPKLYALKVTGQLKKPADGKDAVLTVLPELGCLSGYSLMVDDSAAVWDRSEKTAFYQMLSASGCTTVLSGVCEEYQQELVLDTVVPMVSGPNNTKKAAAAAQCGDTAVTAVFIGGCSSGRVEDIRVAAAIAKGKRVQRKVRTMVAFATTQDYVTAANEGLIATLLDAGVLVMNQGCSACYAHSQGVVDGKDIVLSAGSRACPNCNGEGDAATYLCSAATAMASAIAGYICPAEV